MGEAREPLHLVLLETDPAARARLHLGLVRLGHRCEFAWEVEQVTSLITASRGVDVLIGALGTRRPTLRAYSRLIARYQEPRRTAFLALVQGLVPGYEAEVLQAGFQQVMVQPVDLNALDATLRALALPLRPRPALDPDRRAQVRAEAGEVALVGLDAAVDEAAAGLMLVLEGPAPGVAEAARQLAAACTAAGFPLAAQEAARLVEEPERPYLRRAVAQAVAAARVAARTERMRAAAGPSP